jgi:hypothetical protein
MTSREDSVLSGRDPSLVNENDWEEFSLSEVRILVPGKSRYANLLTATPENPVQVTGCLDEVEEEQESLGSLIPYTYTILYYYGTCLTTNNQLTHLSCCY